MSQLLKPALALLVAFTFLNVVKASKLSIEGTFKPREVYSNNTYRKNVRRKNYLSKSLKEKIRQRDAAKKLYKETRNTKYLNRYIAANIRVRTARLDLKKIKRKTSTSIRVRVVAGKGGKYDKMPQLGPNESVADFLKKRSRLLGSGRTIVINAPHLAEGSTVAQRTVLQVSNKTKKSKRSRTASNKKKSKKSRLATNKKKSSTRKPKFISNPSNPNIQKSRLTPGKGGGILGTGN